jgi:hypothetical protein
MLSAKSYMFSFILSLYKYLKMLLGTPVPKRPITSKKYTLRNKYSHPVKLFRFLLCFNVFLASTNHVICMEMPGKGITRAHLQLYDCNCPQNNEVTLRQINHEAPQDLPTGLWSKSSSCPSCIDEHIQFRPSSVSLDYSPAITTIPLLPVFQNYSPAPLLPPRKSLVQRRQHITPSFYQLSVIRSTVLLI